MPSLREYTLLKNMMDSADSVKADQPGLDISFGWDSKIASEQQGDLSKSEQGKCAKSDQYFSCYDDVEVHRLMLQDKPRTDAYKEAILANKHLFKDKVVMDVGAGTGILSLFAMKAGARKVYAVEASPLADVLKEIVELNDKEGVIQVIHGKAEELDLPEDEKVDVMISEWMGFYLLHESMLDSVILARERHLQDDGIMFPSHATLLAAPVQMDQFYKERFGGWEDVYGFDMTPMAQKAVEARLAGGQPEIMSLSKEQLLSDEVIMSEEFDLKWVTLDEVKAVNDRKFVSITKPGNFHGLAVWFRVKFKPDIYEGEYEEELTPVVLCTGPGSPETHWKQTVIVLPRAEVEVEEDEVVGWEMNMVQNVDNPRHYNLGLSLLDPAEDEHPMPCGCKMVKCALYAALLEKEEADFEEMSLEQSKTS